MTRKMVETIKKKDAVMMGHQFRLLKRYTVERFNKELEIKFVVEERGWSWRHPFDNDVIR